MEDFGDSLYRSHGVLWLDHTPRFLTEAEDYPAAMTICNALGISDIEELKKRLRQSTQLQFARRTSPFYSHEIDNIGSQGGGAIVFGDK